MHFLRAKRSEQGYSVQEGREGWKKKLRGKAATNTGRYTVARSYDDVEGPKKKNQ